MQVRNVRSTYYMSIVVALLMLVCAGASLVMKGVYRDNAFLVSIWRGNDLVTIAVALPLLVVSMLLARRGSLQGLLMWYAMLWFTCYNYTYYLFGAAFNAFFLLYAALVTVSMWALVFGLAGLNVDAIASRFKQSTPVKSVAGYMLFVAAGLTIVYIIQCVLFITQGKIPDILTLTGHPTSIVFALDLTLVVSFFIVAAVFLWQRKPWGYAMAVILNAKGAVYTLVLAVASLTSGNTAELPLWAMLTVGGLIASGAMLTSIKREETV